MPLRNELLKVSALRAILAKDLINLERFALKDLEDAGIWDGCELNRETDAEIIERFVANTLEQRHRAGKLKTLVLNLDAPWGGGKTFFLKRFQRHLSSKGHPVIYIDAWKDDHSNDPFLTVVDELMTELSKHLPEEVRKKKAKSFFSSVASVAGTTFWHTGKHWLAKALSQEAVETLGDALTGGESDQPVAEQPKPAKDPEDDSKHVEAALATGLKKAADEAGGAVLQAFKISKSVRAAFHENLRDLIKQLEDQRNTQAPVYVFVDELDRCRPDFAIELLESIKHLFAVDGLVFILSTDTEQLIQATHGVFGPEIDGHRYLERFIDRKYRFQETKLDKFVKVTIENLGMDIGKYEAHPNLSLLEVFTEIFDQAGTPPRTIEKILEIVATFEAAWPYEKSCIFPPTVLALAARTHLSSDETTQFEAASLRFQSYQQSGQKQVMLSDIVSRIDQLSLRNSLPSTSSEYDHWINSCLNTSYSERVQKEGFPSPHKMLSQQYMQIMSRMVIPIDGTYY